MNDPAVVNLVQAERTSATADRRSAERHLFETPPPTRFLVRPNFQALPASIHDFSEQGIGLVFTRELGIGTLLALRLKGGQVGVSGILTAEVRHASPLPDGYWLLGCRLNRELTYAERYALMRNNAFVDDHKPPPGEGAPAVNVDHP